MKNKKIKFKNSRRGFTLIEVLIASAIFASMLVMATGVIGQTSAYQSRLKAMRETSEETRRIADMITRDVRSANASSQADSDPSHPKFKNGIEIIHIEGVYPSIITWNLSTPTATYDAGILLLTTKENHKMYYSINGKIYLKIVPNNGGGYQLQYWDSFMRANPNGIDQYRISDPNLNVNVDFGGYAPKDGATNMQQPFVKFRVIAETLNTTGPNHYKSEIDSTVTGRSYNQ